MLVLHRVLIAVDNLIAGFNTFIPLGIGAVREYLCVEVHLGKQGIGSPFVETSVILHAVVFAQVWDILGKLLDDEVVNLLAGALIGQIALFHVETGNDGHIAEEVDKDIIIGSTEHLQL